MMSFIQFIRVFLVLVTYMVCSEAANTLETLKIAPTITKGMVIDAGSGGSRLHVYTWKPRVFTSSPPALSFPEGNEKWTARMGPGVASFADNLDGVYWHLKPLIEFAKKQLIAEQDNYEQFPIYFYATGGVRLLSTKKRDALIDRVRELFKNDTFCPFFFKNSFARVISGKLGVS
jgi:Golgi nucleoside diphosphatase